MKKKTALISILLLCSGLGFAAYYVSDTDFLARVNPAGRQLDRLLDDMQVIRIPGGTNPVEVRLLDINGTSVDLADFKGKIVLLNFWATWCPTCVIEMPAMEKLHQKLQNKDFAMLAISIQEPASQVKNFFDINKLTFPVLLDSTGETVIGFGIRAIPTTFILDKAGRIIGLVTGPREWDSRESIAMFEYLIDRYAAVSAVPASDPINLDNM
ncbi:MAG: TlpA family protein disulfide reductase [Deltaproteobacteria bacterium]|nr:TlpA family protein disulfide reductase [Deltaproteobacteria bacterium]